MAKRRGGETTLPDLRASLTQCFAPAESLSIKNLNRDCDQLMVGKGGLPPLLIRSSTLLVCVRLRVYHCSRFNLLCPFYNHRIAGFQSVFDDPRRAGAIADFDGAHFNFVIATHYGYLIAALQLSDGPLRNQ